MKMAKHLAQSSLLLGRQLSKQKFSSVFEGTWHASSSSELNVAIKRTKPELAAAEVEALSIAQGHPGILALHGVCEFDSNEHLGMTEDACLEADKPKRWCAHEPPPHFAGSATMQKEEEGPDEELWIVTELAAGSCKSYMADCRQEWGASHWQAILAQVASAMTYLHSRNRPLVHRDIKTENIFVRSSGTSEPWPAPQDLEVMIADFDRADEVPAEMYFKEPVGSIYYMAPEMLRWDPYGPEVDVYAFGMLIFELTQPMPPFLGKIAAGLPGTLTMKEFAHEVGENGMRPRFIREDDDVSPYRDLIERCWHQDPGSRPSFPEVEQALADLLRRSRERLRRRDGQLRSDDS